MGLSLFKVKKGFSINGEIYQIYGSEDPSHGTGIAAPLSSIYFRSNGELWHKIGSGDTEWKKVLDSTGASVEDGYQNDFIGKSLGENLPQYTEENYIDDDDDLNTAVDKLDISLNDVDNGLTNKNPFKITATNQNCDPEKTIDSVELSSLVSVLWKVTVIQSAAPTNMYSCLINALSDGTNIDFSESSILTMGSDIPVLNFDVEIDTGNLCLRLYTTALVNYRIERISQ